MPKPKDHDERDFVSTFEPNSPRSQAEELAQLFEGTSEVIEDTEDTRLTSIRVRSSVLAQIDAYCRKVDRSRSWVMDRMVSLALQELVQAMSPDGVKQLQKLARERQRELAAEADPSPSPRKAA